MCDVPFLIDIDILYTVQINFPRWNVHLFSDIQFKFWIYTVYQ